MPPIDVKQQSKEQYYDKYALSYSNSNYGNLWSAEHLTNDQILTTNQMKRYDRGFTISNDNMPDVQSQQQIFVWQNIIPQDHKLNTGKWNWIEYQTRQLARKYDEVYVVMGPTFKIPAKMIGPSKV